MTPAVQALERAGVAYETMRYDAPTDGRDYGGHAADQLGVRPAEVYKTLVAQTDRGLLVVALVAVDARLDTKKLAAALGAKKTTLAERTRVERTTGYVLGGVSPLGQKQRLPTVIDSAARDQARIHISGGRRGLEIMLAPQDLARLIQADFAPITA